MGWERKNELMPRQGFCPVCCSGLFGSVAFPVPVSLRWVLIHLIGESARHNGHADLLRERIDGAIGL